MKNIILSLSIISALIGFSILSIAESAIHEIESFILFVISAILLSGFGIMHKIDNLNNKK